MVKSINPSNLDYSSFNAGPNSIAVIQVRAGGSKAVTPVIPFKRFMSVNNCEDPELNVGIGGSGGRPNDTLIIGGKGSVQGAQAYIGQTQLSDIKFNGAGGSSTSLSTRLPKSFFGESNDQDATQIRKKKKKNPDGKIASKDFTFYISPWMTVSDIQPDKPTYSLGAGGTVKIYITGRCLKSSLTVKLTGSAGSTVSSETALGVSGFPSTATVEFSPSGLGKGNYNVGLWIGSTWYGACSFKVVD